MNLNGKLPDFLLSGDAQANLYYNYDRIELISKWLQEKVGNMRPLVGIICGSGLSMIGERVENSISIAYDEIPDFPRSTVDGHKGNLIFGHIHCTPVVCMQGRFHPYEGYVMAVCTMPIKVFKLLGVRLMLLTNAAGALNKSFKIGDLMLIRDHLSYPMFALQHPLIGPNDTRFGPRFLPINNIYTKDLRDLMKLVSEQITSVRLHEGVYAAIGGPTYETVSDTRLLRESGADAVGMSTAHEAIMAAYCGMKVLALSIITDMTIDEHDCDVEPDHAEICRVAREKTKDVERLVLDLIEKLDTNFDF